MSGYALHPEAYLDVDIIREYIAEDNPDAADRVVAKLFDAMRAFGPFSASGSPASGPHFAPVTFPPPPRFSDRVRA
jgi:plasmid stabilization system protein ParE